MCAAVSIIIPVYNAQEYLQQCLGNVVNQTLQDIEVILVNDASTDQSLSIMKECQRQYPDKVKLLIQSKCRCWRSEESCDQAGRGRVYWICGQ